MDGLIDASIREDWILGQVDRGVEVLITNPDLVKTGLDLLDFPTLAFLQSGYSVYTLQQVSRRSWQIDHHTASASACAALRSCFTLARLTQ